MHAAFPTNKTDRNDIGEILLKVALNTINITLTIMLTGITRHVKYRLLFPISLNLDKDLLAYYNGFIKT